MLRVHRKVKFIQGWIKGPVYEDKFVAKTFRSYREV